MTMPGEPLIYLDNNATTRPDPQVLEAMHRCARQGYGNPASPHAAGRAARRELEDHRERIVELLGGKCDGQRHDRLVFTSGGTEANNLAFRGLAPPTTRRFVSAIEHPSLWELAHSSCDPAMPPVVYLPCDTTGQVDVASLDELLPSEEKALVSCMLANNETGVIEPVAEIADRVHRRGGMVHTDAVQAIGKIPVSFRLLGVDAMTVSPHKFHGPIGIGAILLREGVSLMAQQQGGGQQGGLRPGTESTVLAAGFRVALELAVEQLDDRARQIGRLRDRFEAGLARVDPESIVNGTGPRLPHTTNVSFVGLDRQALLVAFDLAGIACSTGSACSSGSSKPSHVLVAMQLSPSRVGSAIRFSLAADTTESDIDAALVRIGGVVSRLRS